MGRRLVGMCGVALSCWASEALACGGLFCSAATPVNQAAERIVFSDNGDGTITAVIEIQYEGPAERFSWVLPVAGSPVVGLSSVAALDRVQQQTNPQYILQTITDDSCRRPRGDFDDILDAGFDSEEDGTVELEESETEAPVLVVASGSLGPFDWTVIEVTGSANMPARAALDWLEENEYDVTSLGEELLGEYLEAGLNLIAFRLNKDADTGSIRPVTLTYEADSSVIPIRPTAVAANEDMGVLVWVLGPERAIPTNFLTLELNELLINWFNPNGNYRDVVTAAANEAGGNGFVTELASRNPSFSVFDESSAWKRVQTLTEPEERLNLLLDSARSLGDLDGFVDVVRATVPLRNGVSVDDYVSCPSCYFPTESEEMVWPYPTDAGVDAGTYTTTHTYPVFPEEGTDPITTIDVEAYLAALNELVIAPMEATQRLFDDAGYVTRLFTTMSPDEMHTDPVFLFNPDLDEVDNVHQRERLVTCNDAGARSWEMDFDGVVVAGKDQSWPVAIGDLPANWRILQLSTSGQGDVVGDNRDAIGDLMPRNPKPSVGPSDPDEGRLADGGRSRSEAVVTGDGSGCGCRTAGRGSLPEGAFALLAVGMVLARRRQGS